LSEDWRSISVDWMGSTAFEGKDSHGNVVIMGKKNSTQHVSPMEMLLLGMAGCTGIDVVDILRKKRQEIESLHLEVRGKRAKKPPRVFNHIEVVFHFRGSKLDPKAIERAISLSEEKYCSASITLGAFAEIKSTYHIEEPESISE
jgi:putative redox protein